MVDRVISPTECSSNRTLRERFLRLPDVVALVGLSKSEVYRQIAAGQFPPNRRYPRNAARRFWLESEIRSWMRSTLAQGDDFDSLL